MSRMQDKYTKEVAPALMEKFGYKSTMQIPKLNKIVINIGMGEAKDNPKAIEAATNDLAAITGQKPIVTKAKKSVANFKLREATPLRSSPVRIRAVRARLSRLFLQRIRLSLRVSLLQSVTRRREFRVRKVVLSIRKCR